MLIGRIKGKIFKYFTNSCILYERGFMIFVTVPDLLHATHSFSISNIHALCLHRDLCASESGVYRLYDLDIFM